MKSSFQKSLPLIVGRRSSMTTSIHSPYLQNRKWNIPAYLCVKPWSSGMHLLSSFGVKVRQEKAATSQQLPAKKSEVGIHFPLDRYANVITWHLKCICITLYLPSFPCNKSKRLKPSAVNFGWAAISWNRKTGRCSVWIGVTRYNM